LAELDARLIPIVKANKPCTVRGVYYQAEVAGIVSKDDKDADLIQRRLLGLRRQGVIPYSSIVDESREVYGPETYDGLDDFANDVASLYRKDYWRKSGVWVQIWMEKRALAGVLRPVTDEWGINLYVCGGQPSETYLWRAGSDIAARKAETHIYVLSDFDPGGESIYEAIAYGTRKVKGGVSRFAKDVPIHVHKLALSAEQIHQWNLPTRKCKQTDRRAVKFMAKHGDISAELDAIAAPKLRKLVSDAIATHMDASALEKMKLIEREERSIGKKLLMGGIKADKDIVVRFQTTGNDELDELIAREPDESVKDGMPCQEWLDWGDDVWELIKQIEPELGAWIGDGVCTIHDGIETLRDWAARKGVAS